MNDHDDEQKRQRRIAELRRIKAEAVAACKQRRERVLKYPDLAARLTERPLCFTKPELWSGYVPPKVVPDSDGYAINTSPYRRALVEISAEAKRREEAGEAETPATGGGESDAADSSR